MLSNRSNTLGGEGCPAVDITKPAENCNIRALRWADLRRFMQNGARTSRPSWHTIDTADEIFDRHVFTAREGTQ
jgi:hypothetical protein